MKLDKLIEAVEEKTGEEIISVTGHSSIVSKDKSDKIEKTFVDTPKGKMWFDHKAYQNEKQWMEDKLNGKK